MDCSNNLHFVSFQGPDQECNDGYAKTSRQHVRKAVMWKRSNGDLYDRIRHFDGLNFLNRPSTHKLPRNRSIMPEAMCASQRTNSSQHQPRASLQTPPHCSGKGRTSSHMEVLHPLTSRLTTWHPYTVYAADCVQMSVDRIDFLFKSCMALSSCSHIPRLIRDRCISQCCGTPFRYEPR